MARTLAGVLGGGPLSFIGQPRTHNISGQRLFYPTCQCAVVVSKVPAAVPHHHSLQQSQQQDRQYPSHHTLRQLLSSTTPCNPQYIHIYRTLIVLSP
jgi:hypothetical protein